MGAQFYALHLLHLHHQHLANILPFHSIPEVPSNIRLLICNLDAAVQLYGISCSNDALDGTLG